MNDGKYSILVDLIKKDILSGKYRSGQSLPSIRAMMRRFKVSSATVQRAFKELTKQGMIAGRQGSGTVVTKLGAFASEPDEYGLGTDATRCVYVSNVQGVSIEKLTLTGGRTVNDSSQSGGTAMGVAVLIFPLVVRPQVTFVAGPGLALISLFSLWVLRDGVCSRGEAISLLLAFLVVMPLYCWFDQKTKWSLEPTGKDSDGPKVNFWLALAKLVVGLGVLIGSSHFLVMDRRLCRLHRADVPAGDGPNLIHSSKEGDFP